MGSCMSGVDRDIAFFVTSSPLFDGHVSTSNLTGAGCAVRWKPENLPNIAI